MALLIDSVLTTALYILFFSDAETKLIQIRKEREYLDKQFTFSSDNVFHNEGQDIIEPYNEEEDKVWRQQHKERIRKYKLSNKEFHSKNNDEREMTDENLWYRLEELELQEELDNEESEVPTMNIELQESPKMDLDIPKDDPSVNLYRTDETNSVKESYIEVIKNKSETSLNILQQAIDKQAVLEGKLMELKNKSMTNSKTENEIISKLDELEELDELEDEINR